MGNIFGDLVFYDRGMQRGEVLVFLLSMLYWIVKNKQIWGAAYVLQIFLQLYDIGITLPSQPTSTVYSKTFPQKAKKLTHMNQKTK